MTPESIQPSQPSRLVFERKGLYFIQAKEGYTVSISNDGTWVYSAWTPKRLREGAGRQFTGVHDPLAGFIPQKSHYRLGDELPHIDHCLGSWRAEGEMTTDAAKAAAIAACEAHRQAVAATHHDGAPGSSLDAPHAGTRRAEFEQ